MPCTVEKLGVGREPTPAGLAVFVWTPWSVVCLNFFFMSCLSRFFQGFGFFGKVGSYLSWYCYKLMRNTGNISKTSSVIFMRLVWWHMRNTQQTRLDLHRNRKQVFNIIAQIHISWLTEQATTQTSWLLKTGFTVSVFILAQSVIADRWMTSQLKWDSGLGAGNRLFLCHNDTVPHSH